MDDTTDTATQDQVLATIARLRESWAWLVELVEPGRERTSAPVLTDTQRARQGAAAIAERADRAANAAAGRGALAPAPAGARLDVIAAKVIVHSVVLDAVRIAHLAVFGATYRGARAGDAAVVDALDWLDLMVDTAAGTGVLAQLDRMLARADAVARRAARVTDDPVAPAGRCPACGRRSLQWQMTGTDSRAWSVVCTSERCACIGPGCGCWHRVRYPGRRHAWYSTELDGPYGLWRAMERAAAARSTGRLGSSRRGHGGWPERGIIG